MKVSKDWLKQLVALNIDIDELPKAFSMRTVAAVKEVTDDFMELDLKGYNRPDYLSMLGVAREAAAITGSNLTTENLTQLTQDDRLISQEEGQLKIKQDVSPLMVEIENIGVTPIYALVKIEGLKVGPSPREWVNKLEACGMRSINNLADITNLIMLEYGQPLHAFDANAVSAGGIIVRTAKSDEKTITLDNKERSLTPEDIVITDNDKVLGIAGVMGGKNSEVTADTASILLEAAIFDPISIRKTSQRLGLYSEASKRFQHGLTIDNLIDALNGAVKLYQDLGGKVTGIAYVGDAYDKVKDIKINLEKVRSLIGMDLSYEEIKELLKKLDFDFTGETRTDQHYLIIRVPSYRLDIEIEEDVIEEIARLYGYEKIPSRELEGELPEKVDQSQFNLINDLRDSFVKAGFTEVQSYSFYGTKTIEALGWNNDRDRADLVKIKNPMSAETEYLRDMIWPNLAEITDKNMRNGFSDVAIFEVGKVYKKREGQISEEDYLAATLVNGSENPLLEMLQIIKQIFTDYPDIEIKVEKFEPMEGINFFHPNRTATIYKGGQEIGGIAEIHQRSTDKFGINKRLAALEIQLDGLNK